jgi:hypothetical protein
MFKLQKISLHQNKIQLVVYIPMVFEFQKISRKDLADMKGKMRVSWSSR